MNNIEHADIELYSLLKARLNKLREVAPGTTDRKKNLRRLLYKIDHADAEKSFKSYNKFINPGNKSLLFSKKYPSTFLIKPAGDACNMRCTYCYEVDRLMNNHQKIMPVATVEKIINDLLTNGNQVDIFFHGGEPLLAGKIFFQHAVNVIRQHPNGKNIVVGVQTNGTLIDDEWACLFAENNFQVGISLDGDKNLHDLNRVFIKNSGTYDAALNGLNLLKKYRVQFGVIVVFTDEVACDIDNAEKIYKHFKSLGIKYYDVHPSLTPKDVSGLSSLYNVTTEHYSSFMLRIFELWLSDNNDDITIRFIEDFIHNLAGLGTNSCYSAGKCIEIAGIDPDGSVSPCTRPFKNKYIFGNAAETQISEIFNSATFNQFTAEEAIGKSATKECIWSRLCGQGGCPHERLNIKTQQQDISGKHIYCTCDTNAKGGYPALFSGMIKRLNNYLA